MLISIYIYIISILPFHQFSYTRYVKLKPNPGKPPRTRITSPNNSIAPNPKDCGEGYEETVGLREVVHGVLQDVKAAAINAIGA